jgi:UDP-N-acetylmuramoyl-tripeptide--D-alanyl-D-alanine ligase
VPRLTVADLVRGTRGALVGGRLEACVTGVSIDSRTCPPGAAFVAIRGSRLDGHAYVADARARGAAAAVVTRLPPDVEPGGDLAVILVDDTTLALQRLAAFHRQRLAPAVVGITGSVGKTTTKELAAAVLGRRYRVLKASGSLNNQWGVPLTLLALEPEHDAAVLELGMNAPGEIAALAELVRPGVGVVTAVAAAHLEGVGSLEGVQRAKGELVEAIPADGTVVLNADDPLVLALAGRARGRVVTFGRAAGADVRVGQVALAAGGLRFRLEAAGQAAEARLPLAGRHNALNAAAAVAVGLALGVPLAAAAAALGEAVPAKGRLAWSEAGGVRLLDDTYNANPASLAAALATLGEAGPGGRAWAVLGDMLELGAHAEAAHREAGGRAAAVPLAGLATAGPLMRLAAEAARAAGCPAAAAFDTPEAAAAWVAARLAPGDRVLVKGSRGMRMERALEALRRALAVPPAPEAARC